MRMRSRLASICCLILAVVTQAVAAEPLRWKFAKGERLRHEMQQTMNNEVVVDANTINTVVDQTFSMFWTVTDVATDGTATIEQKFDRIQMKMTLPQGQGFTYDSDSKEAPQGMAAMIAPMFSALLEGTITLKMSTRGEVIDATIPEEFAAAIKNSPGGQLMGDMASAEGLKRMAEQASLRFPEEDLKIGESMSSKIEMKAPMIGKQIVETTYKYNGPKEVEGKTYESFTPAMKITIEPLAADEQAKQPAGNVPAASDVKVTEQDSTGEILFSREEGRMISSKINQKFTLDMSVAGKSVSTKVDQNVNVDVKPVSDGEE